MANYLFGLFEKTTKPFPPAHLWPNGVAPDIEILREVIWTYPAPPRSPRSAGESKRKLARAAK